MKDAAKRDWWTSTFLIGSIIYLVVWFYAAFLSPFSMVKDVLAILAYFAYAVTFFLLARLGKLKPGERYAGYVLAGILLLLVISKLNEDFIHIYVSYDFTIVLLVLCGLAVVAAFLMMGHAYDLSKRGVQQQKQLDQTRLEPIYGESAKHDKVKEQ